MSSADDANARHIAIVGAGFAGVATAYHVFRQVADAHAEATADGKTVAPVRVTLIDEKGVAGGASGVAAGLLHPYTPRGKIIWRGTEGVAATLELVEAAENAERVMEAAARLERGGDDVSRPTVSPRRGRAIARRAGVCRPARSLKQARDLAKHAPLSFAAGGKGVAVSAEELRRLIPGVDVPPEVVEATRRFLRGDGDDGDDGDDASRARPLTRADERAASKKRREERNAPVTSALHVPEGLVLDTTRYLASLWDAARLLASSGETPAGCSATMEIRSVASIEGDEELNAPNAYDAVVIACGAAAGSVRELEGDLLPTQLQGGTSSSSCPTSLKTAGRTARPASSGRRTSRRSRPSACWSGPPRSTARPSPTRGARGRYRSRTRKRRGRRLRRRASSWRARRRRAPPGARGGVARGRGALRRPREPAEVEPGVAAAGRARRAEGAGRARKPARG